MKRKVKYAIMEYVPSVERGEKMNVAVMLHSPSDEFLETKIIKNTRRLKEFDDELDIEFMKAYLKSVKNEFTYDISTIEKININDEMLLDKMSQFYINQFAFVIFEVVIESSCEEFLSKLKSNYLYYDIDKQKRITKNDSVEFFEELLKGKNISYELIRSKNGLIGNFGEKINVDLKIDGKYYKIINFNDSNISTYITVIKMWMLNAIELEERNIKLVFVINEQILNEKVSKFVKMLNKYGEVIQMNEFNKYFK